jgi:N-acetylmuramoyl-L-alanine amidase
VVVLDPGHGGNMPPPPPKGNKVTSEMLDGSSYNNAWSYDYSLMEATLTLEYAQALADALASADNKLKPGDHFKVILTRNDNIAVSAMQRAAVAVENNADVFLSIHFNAFDDKNRKPETKTNKWVSGTRLYYVDAHHAQWQYYDFNNPYDDRDKEFCRIIKRHVENAFQAFGGVPHPEQVPFSDSNDRRDGIRVLGYVRQETHLWNCAVALIETEFLDNKNVDAWLIGPKKEEVKRSFALATIDALVEYYQKRDQWKESLPKKVRP